MEDNSPSKNDPKDSKTIAGLVRKGEYFYSYIPTRIYAELRTASNRRFIIVKEQTIENKRIQRRVSVYFPEYSYKESCCNSKEISFLKKILLNSIN